MLWSRTGSALLALAVLAATAGGQPPTKVVPPEPMPKKADPKPAGTDALIATALATDPDVKMARAKIQLAEAELAKARLAVTLKVTALASAVEQNRLLVEVAQEHFKLVEQRFKAAVEPQSSLLEARAALARAQALLASAETELKLLTGGHDAGSAKSVELGLRWLGQQQEAEAERALMAKYWSSLNLAREAAAVKGPVPDRLRAALDKPVKLGPKGEKVTFSKALGVFKKDAGMDVPFRALPLPEPEVVSEGEELPVGAWLQLYQDTARLTFYVREYGLLAANKQTAPPDAPTLTEFWKQKPPAAKLEPKPEPAPEPKPK